MSLHKLLCLREKENNPIKIGVIGVGRYGTMFLSQSRNIPGMKIIGVADIDAEKASINCIRAGWNEENVAMVNNSNTINDLSKKNKISVTDNAENIINADLDIIIEATGTVDAAARYAWSAFEAKKSVVMISAESDALLGVALQRKAKENGVVYSFGCGDEPAELCEIIDWSRTSGFEVVCIGKYSDHIPEKRYVTPGTVWEYKTDYSKELLDSGDLNDYLYSSFLDGTKTLTENCCAANASNIIPPKNGIHFPAMEYEDMANLLRPKSDGGILEHSGTIEVPSRFHKDGTPVNSHLRWGVFVSVKACTKFAQDVLIEFKNENRIKVVDDSGNYAIIYKPTHILGLELGRSVASVGLFGLPTGCPSVFVADMVSVAKCDLKPGDLLDGPGAYTVYGQLIPADESLKNNYLPTGLTENVKVVRSVSKDSIIKYDDVEIDNNLFSFKIRKSIEKGDF